MIVASVETAEKTIVRRGLLLECVVGSTVHGLHVGDGTDDVDLMGIYCEPPEYVLGFCETDGGIASRQLESVEERTRGRGERSRAGDVDAIYHCLHKWARLALNGNPTVLIALFAPPGAVRVQTSYGDELRAMAPAFASRRAGGRFLGYCQAQRLRLTAARGSSHGRRPELEQTYGYDTKAAMHVLRLAYQGIEYLMTGRLTLPMAEIHREHLRAVRLGAVPLEDVLAEAEIAERRLAALREESPLPPVPDVARVERFVVDTYRAMWGWK